MANPSVSVFSEAVTHGRWIKILVQAVVAGNRDSGIDLLPTIR
jgi:hypothetical protein